MMAKRFGRATDGTWKNMVVNDRVVNGDFGKCEGRVMFPSSHDIVDTPEVKEACFEVMRKLLVAGNDLLVTTKPSLSITRGIVKTFVAFRPHLQFRFTITSCDNALLSFWEPGAPLFEERLASLKHAYQASFKTSVSVEPFLDYDPGRLVDMLLPYITESIWIGPMNYIARKGIPRRDEPQYAKIRKALEPEHLRRIHDDLESIAPIRFKDSMRHRLSR
jgi:DNA repair photolyase